MNLPNAKIEMICSQRSEIAAYIDGELNSREEIELEMHLINCKSCAAELNEQKKMLLALDCALETEKEIELPADFTKVVVANAESKVSGLRRPQERFNALLVCAALFLLIILGLGAEIKTVIGSLGRFADQFTAVGGFFWSFIYDAAIGTAVILRWLNSQVIFNSTVASIFLLGVFFILLSAISHLVIRLNRSRILKN